MRPPPHAPVTPFDVNQMGITPKMLQDKPPASVVLAKIDAEVELPTPSLLVAHNAPTEAGILFRYRQYCPRLAATHFLDTVRLARVVYPDLESHSLDTISRHLGIRRPPDRHRAYADVQVTIQVFAKLLRDGARKRKLRTLRDLRAVSGYQAKAAIPEQASLFDDLMFGGG